MIELLSFLPSFPQSPSHPATDPAWLLRGRLHPQSWYRLIDGSCVAFLPGWFQSADAAPDDGFAAVVVPVDSAEHFAAFAANDNLCKAVVAAVGALFAIGTGFEHSPAIFM